MSKYTPPTSFADVSFDLVRDFVAARALCTLVAVTPVGLINAHAPILLAQDGEGGFWLEGHVAKATSAFNGLDVPVTALAMFQKEQAYGLPEVARVADAESPWGAVHLHGRLEMVRDAAFQLGNIEALADHHMAAQIHPWNAPDLPAAFREVLAEKTVGFRFHIERAQACHAYAAKGAGRTDGIVDIDPREFTSPNCRPRI
ncbi:MAG: FMN-binding negative transcriptional regulator [Beijerinckiaceae bacterium]